MPGMFDDLVPQQAPGGFDDLIPPPEPPPEAFLHRLTTGLSAGWDRTKELASEGVGQVQTGLSQLGGAHPPPEELPPWLDRAIAARPELKDANERTWQKVKGMVGVLGGAFTAATSPIGMVSAPAEQAAGRDENGNLNLPKEVTEFGIGLAGPALPGVARKFFRMRGGAEQVIGELPKAGDFENAAAAVANQPPETIKSAAIRLKDGSIYTGTTHADALLAAQEARGEHVANDITSIDEKSIAGDFLTSKGRLVGRFEAEKIANAAEQTKRTEPDTLGLIAENLKDLWQERGIHPAEAAHDAQADAFLKHDLTTPVTDPAAKLPAEDWTAAGAMDHPYEMPMYRAPDPLDLAMSGQLNSDVARQIGEAVKSNQSAIEDKIFGSKETADQWRKLHRMSDRAWDNARDADAKKYDQQISELEAKANLTDRDQAHLNGEGWPEHSDPEAWKELSRNLQDIEAGREDAVRVSASAVRYIPKKSDWSKMDSREQESVITLLTAMNEEVKAGRDPQKFLKDVFEQRIQRYGGGHDAREVAQGQMEDLANFMKEGIKREGPLSNASLPAPARMPPEDSGKPVGAAGADVTRDMPDFAKQPPPPAGSLAETARAAMDQAMGLGRNIQGLLDPMATGSNRAMVVAKDAMNTVRRIRWEHYRLDQEIMTNPEIKAARDALGETQGEQLARMWNAADEESVAIQLGESREHQGLVTLDPAERAMVERLHANAQAAWLHVRDVGMVEGDGLPAYTPRMVLNVGAAAEHGGPQALNDLGRNVFTRTSQMLHRGHMTAEETEAAARAIVGKRMAERGASVEEINAALEKVAIARNIRALPLATARLEEAAVWHEMINKIEDMGKATGEGLVAPFKPDSSWFTVAGNPAFTKWRPHPSGTLDDAGRPIWVPMPVYLPGEFRGPMRAILDEGIGNYKAIPGAQSLYGAMMALKGKAMTAILNSPLIHNEVVWSKAMEAAGGKEWMGFGLYFRGNRIVNNPGRSSELIERGLNWMGPRGSIQDITGMQETPNLAVGQSWTAKVLGAVPGLFDEAAGTAVKAAVDKAGNFWHNTLLWDRVRDLQFGLADHLSDRLVSKGADRLTADRIATHFSNIIVGSIPKEAMSASARATANMMLFSRSFTLGNLATFKQAALGLPKPILAQIERDFGMSAEAAIGEGAVETIKSTAQQIARRKAISTVVMSAGLYYVGNALIQHAFNMAAGDSTLEQEMNGYARRYRDLMSDAAQDPFELRHLVGRLSPTYDNEPQKQDRAHIGYDKDGTAIYARNPTGKFGEEMIGYPTMPLEMIKRKLSPLAGGILELMENDKGFGKKIYDPNDMTLGGDVNTAFSIAKHLVMKHLPEGQINAGLDLLRGEGDKTTNQLRLFGPAFGFTASVGAPGGPARGEQLAAKDAFESRFNIAWPDIRKQIQRGDVDGARDALKGLGVPNGMQNGLIKSATNPAGMLKGRTLRDFYQYATPAQKARLEEAR